MCCLLLLSCSERCAIGSPEEKSSKRYSCGSAPQGNNLCRSGPACCAVDKSDSCLTKLLQKEDGGFDSMSEELEDAMHWERGHTLKIEELPEGRLGDESGGSPGLYAQRERLDCSEQVKQLELHKHPDPAQRKHRGGLTGSKMGRLPCPGLSGQSGHTAKPRLPEQRDHFEEPPHPLSFQFTGARGGPLSFPGLVSGLINVREFHESSNALKTALTARLGDSSVKEEEDFSVDDLKIYTDAMLVEGAFGKVLQGEKSTIGGITSDSVERIAVSVGSSRQPIQTEAAGSTLFVFPRSIPPKRGPKKGRPFDRDTRQVAWTDEAHASRVRALDKMKKQRDLAKEKAPLRCLRAEEKFARDFKMKKQWKLPQDYINATLKTPDLAFSDPLELLKDGEVLFTVDIYDNRAKNPVKMQEFVVYGSQPLTALRDRIYCILDTVAQRAGCQVPSGYFLIENCFYNDMRHPKAIDYSLPHRKLATRAKVAIDTKGWGETDVWDYSTGRLHSSKRELPVYRAADMAVTTFMDLHVRLGKDVVYRHLGNCYHAIVFRDIRLVHNDDVQNAAAYPLAKFEHKFRHRKCSICSLYAASKVTRNDKLAPETPCYFCDACYFALHYDKDGNILYDDFVVKSYYHEYD